MAASTGLLEMQYNIVDTVSLYELSFSVVTDELPNLAGSLPSLLLAETLEGRSPTEMRSSLLSLPQELLPRILHFLGVRDLAQLALVNSDCRQLARTRQFQNLHCDSTKCRLLQLLEEEADQRSRSGGSTQRPGLGVCVRRLTIATSPSLSNHVHDLLTFRKTAGYDLPDIEEPMQAVSDLHFGVYMGLVRRTVARALPNLDIISWNDSARLDPHTLKAILETSARHFKLGGAFIDDEIMRVIKSISDWKPSKTSSLDVDVTFFSSNLGAAVSFMASLLQQCADSLMNLKWHTKRYGGRFEESAVIFPTLPRLKRLSLAHELDHSPGILSSLISTAPACRLVHLEISFASVALQGFLDDHGNMPALKSFVWTSWLVDDAWPMQFLAQNTLLETLSLMWPPAFLMDNQILPLLRNRFLHLLSLEIGYNKFVTTVPAGAWEAIAGITTLQQLHLTAEDRYENTGIWVTDHAAIRRYVKQLPNLKILGLSRDMLHREDLSDQNNESIRIDGFRSYQPQNEVETSLLKTFRPRNSISDWRARYKWVWEMMHRRRMLQLGNKYVNLRYKGGPKLEFLYIGQVPMEVTYGWHGYRARAVTERRDECDALLQRMFKREYAMSTGHQGDSLRRNRR